MIVLVARSSRVIFLNIFILKNCIESFARSFKQPKKENMNLSIKHYISKTLIQKIFLTITFTLLTAIATHVTVPLPFSPVPLTLQTFMVILSGFILGTWLGGLSQLLFVIGFRFSEIATLGPRAGYLIGFVFTAMFVGFACKLVKNFKHRFSFAVLISIISMAFYYVPGLLHLGFWLKFVQHQTPSIATVLTLGFVPFIVGDLIKAVAAAIFYSQINRSNWITRKNS